ncbi:hypothetical protein DL96DRAFT_1812391 [Flagelloscypha sp. PMI_526]|nr:hypothetical protein DL96DRAFT_1812391 [Flagelloscypha sp. PMI_526]
MNRTQIKRPSWFFHRKIRCDGALPICGPCQIIPGGDEDCEYRDELGGKTRTEELEENIARLEQRILDLGNQAEAISDNTLERPTPSRVSSPAQEVRSEETNVCLAAFFANYRALGCFLHPDNFRSIVMGAPIQGSMSSASLLNAACLWGARMAPQNHSALESMFLARAQHCLTTDFNPSDTGRVLCAIQAHLLLALYYIDLGHTVRGGYHSNAAVSLALSARLANWQPKSSPPSIEDVERLRGFWSCLIIANHFATCGSPFHFSAQATRSITTPWPDPNSASAMLAHPRPTVVSYIQGNLDGGSTVPATLLAKSSILYEWASTLFREDGSPTHEDGSTQVNCALLEARINSILPTIPLCSTTISQSTELTLAHAFTHASIIRNFSPFSQIDESKRDRCFLSAFEIVAVIREHLEHGVHLVNPMLWVVYGICFSVLKAHKTMSERRGIVAGRTAQDSEDAMQDVSRFLKRFSDRRPLETYLA